MVLLFSAVILVFFLGMAFVSAGTIKTKGGIYNNGFEYGTGSVVAGTGTTAGVSYIGDKNYGWQCFRNGSASGTCSYSTTQKHSGNQSIKIDTNISNASGRRFTGIGINWDSSISAWDNENKINIIRAKPNTTYKYSAWVYNEDANIAYIYLMEGNSNGTYVDSTISSYVLPTATWTYVTINVTTSATTQELSPQLLCASNDSLMTNGTCYFDDVRLEEVDTVSLSTQSSGRPSLTITGVTDTNAIDQSQTTTLGVPRAFGYPGALGWAQQFTPTQQKLTGITFRKSSLFGTGITNNVIISIRTNNAESPSTTVLASKTYTAAQFNALSNTEDIFTELSAILTDANYWIVLTTDANDSTNYARIYYDSGAGYANGLMKQSADGTTWGSSYPGDLYFKTHFAKHSSSVDLNVVAPDGTSELKSFDVNGDILTDANITINPDGTGRYFLNGTAINAIQDLYSWNRLGTLVSASFERWMLLNAIFDTNVVMKFKMPVGCTIDGNARYNWQQGFNTNVDRNYSTSYSGDGVNWLVDFNASETMYSSYTWRSIYADGNSEIYIKLNKESGGTNYIGRINFDANLSCPTLTTPLFKNGTNTNI